MASPRPVFLHLTSRALGVVRGIDLEFLTEAALQLEAVVEQSDLAGIPVGDLPERWVATWSAVIGNTVVAIAQMRPLISEIDWQEAPAPVARLECQFLPDYAG